MNEGGVLVTGGAGFIGSHLCEALLARGQRVTVLDNFDPVYDPARKRAQLPAGVRLVEGCLTDPVSLGDALTDVASVFHLAARAGVRPSLIDAAPYVHTNVVGTVALLHAMRDRGVRRMAFASSSSVYGARRGVAFREDDAADQPASPYAASKRAGELFCAAAAASWGLNVACVRLFTVYGPRQRPEMAFSRFLHQMRSGDAVTVYGDGASARDYTYVSDAVAGLIAAHDAALGARSVNIAGGAVTPLIEAVQLLAAAVGVDARLQHFQDQPGDVPETRADLQVATRWLGWSPQVSMTEGLRRFAASPDR